MTRRIHPNDGDRTEGSDAGIPAEGQTVPVARRRRRWRLKLAFAMVVVIGLFVFCLPYLASTPAGTRFVVAGVNGSLPGTLSLQSLSLSWLGPCELKGVHLADPEGREVVHVDEVALAKGVWGLATSTVRFEKLNIESPRVTLYVDAQGSISLFRSFGGKEQPAEEPAGPLPALTGAVVLNHGAITIVRADGRQLKISGIDGSFNLEAMSTMTGKLLVQDKAMGTVAAEIDIQQLTSDGRLQLVEAIGKARLSTPVRFSLASVEEFAFGQVRAGGTADLEVNADFAGGEVKVGSRLTLAGLQVRRADSVNTEPVDVHLSSQIHATRESVTARTALEGQIGDGRLDATYVWPKQVGGLSLDDVVSGVLSGESVAWPEVSAEAELRVDLARLTRAVPALLRIHPDVVVVGGELRAQNVVLKGGARPSTTGSFALRELSSRRGGQVNVWEPIALSWDVRIEPDTGLRVEQVAFTSGFAHLSAKGSPSDLHAEFQSNLAVLQQQLAQVFEMGGVDLAGGASGTLDLKRVSAERIDLALTMTADEIRYRAGERHLEIGKLAVQNNGYFTLAGPRVNRLTLASVTWNTDGRVVGTGSGWMGIGDSGFGLVMAIQQADLGYLAERLAGLGVTGAGGYTGEATLQVKAQRQSQDLPITAEGAVVVRNTKLHGASLVAEEVSLTWSGLSIVPVANQLEVKSLELVSPPVRLSATGVKAGSAPQPVFEGTIEGVADLAQCLAIGSRISGREKPPAIGGRLGLSVVSQSAVDGVKLAGDARVDGLAIGAGSKTIREDQLRLAVQANLDSRRGTITVDQFQVASQLLAIKCTGKIEDYARTCLLDLSGDYHASWDAITALLHELVPGTVETLAVTGASQSRFTVTGTANQPEVSPAFRDTTAAVEAGWASATICGVQMGEASFAPALRQGQLTLPASAVSAAGGQVRLGGVLDFRPSAPVLNLGRQLQILENVRITPELGRELLSRVNPIFASMTRAEGSVSLMTENVQLPLGEEMKTSGSGQGRLDLQSLKVQPAGLMMALLELGGLAGGDRYTVQVGSVDFYLRDGRLYYEKFALTFDQGFDLLFHGSVGFDDTVDLAVSLPVRPALLTRLGVSGPVADYARRLEKARVELPIVGTRLQPRLDLSQVDLKPLIEEAARSAVSQTADGLLKGLLGSQQAPRPESDADRPNQRRGLLPRLAAPERSTTKPAAPANRPIRDPLRRERR